MQPRSEAYLARQSRIALDVDRDGQTLALTDGLMILRWLLGLDGAAVTKRQSLWLTDDADVLTRIDALKSLRSGAEVRRHHVTQRAEPAASLWHKRRLRRPPSCLWRGDGCTGPRDEATKNMALMAMLYGAEWRAARNACDEPPVGRRTVSRRAPRRGRHLWRRPFVPRQRSAWEISAVMQPLARATKVSGEVVEAGAGVIRVKRSDRVAIGPNQKPAASARLALPA